MFRCFTISALLHAGLIFGMLVLMLISPPVKRKIPPMINLSGFGGKPNLPPGPAGPASPPSAAEMLAATPAPSAVPSPASPAKKEEPAPTPRPTPAASPRPQTTPAAKPPIVKPPTPKPQATPKAESTPKPAPPTVKPPLENKKPAAPPIVKRKPKTPQKLVEISHTPVPTPTPKVTPKPTPEPHTEEIVGTVGEDRTNAPAVPASPDPQVAMTAPAVPAAPTIPMPPAPTPAITGAGGTGTGQKLSTGGSISGGISMPGSGFGGGGGGGGTLLNSLSQTYLAILVNRVEENFKPPFSRPGVFCQVQFLIEKSGAITKIQIVKPTGVESLDHLAVQALEMTKLPQLYDGMDVTALPVMITFDFNNKKSY